ncbi:MAG: geranylgeranyl diphosphate reductase [Geminicoccaceae bacterium]|nr:MAG: geranylgeranyl diphosphate reductase [Geminicoccaceae bacterium]
MRTDTDRFDAVVVGGGPAGATAACELALNGRHVLLLDRAGRIKPCGGAIPPRAIQEFAIPDQMLVAKIKTARIISPKAKSVDIPIEGGFVGMVDREHFDEWLRERAAASGAVRRTGTFERLTREPDGTVIVHYRPGPGHAKDAIETVRTRTVIGADGAKSAVGRQEVPGADTIPYVFAYHEIAEAPAAGSVDYDPSRCDVYYRGSVSPDFYGWVFPHGRTVSIGTGSAHKGFSLRGSTAALREAAGLDQVKTLRHEGAPIPLQPLTRWDNGKDVVLAGDAAGVVAPASGEGIFYAMLGGRLAAEAVDAFCEKGDTRALALARKRFMRAHGNVFWILGMMQRYWYTTDERRERFVAICRDKDVQELTFDAYMNKELVKAKPLAHVRIFFKNIAHLTGVVPA